MAVGTSSWAKDGSRLVTGTEGVTKDGEGATSEGEQGNSTVDNRLIPPPGAEVVDEADRALTAFRRVLKDVGYDVWGLDQTGRWPSHGNTGPAGNRTMYLDGYGGYDLNQR